MSKVEAKNAFLKTGEKVTLLVGRETRDGLGRMRERIMEYNDRLKEQAILDAVKEMYITRNVNSEVAFKKVSLSEQNEFSSCD